MKFPKRLKHRKKTLATIYAPKPGHPFYRLYWRVRGADGKARSRIRDFATYAKANKAGEELLKDLAQGSQVTALTPGQANDALLAFKVLQAHYQATGKRLSLHEVVAQFCAVTVKLDGHSLGEAADGFLSSVAKVTRKDLGQAVEDFIETRRLRTVPRKEGERPKLSPEHHYNTSRWLKEFARTFPATCVSDLTVGHLERYVQAHAKLGSQARNERRSLVKMLLQWCVGRGFLSPTHNLFPKGGPLEREAKDDTETEVYSAQELRSLLERAAQVPAPAKEGKEPERDFRPLLPALVLAGLAGLRFREIVRLDWEDVLGRPDYIEVKAHKSKTRSRRLIQVRPALAAWLQSYRGRGLTGPVWPKGEDMLHEDFAALRDGLEISAKRNGLRHSFISALLAVTNDENLVSAEAGNSPDVVHKNYKALLEKPEGEAWFAVLPEQPDNVLQLPTAVKK